jgi:PAP2 superfamily
MCSRYAIRVQRGITPALAGLTIGDMSRFRYTHCLYATAWTDEVFTMTPTAVTPRSGKQPTQKDARTLLGIALAAGGAAAWLAFQVKDKPGSRLDKKIVDHRTDVPAPVRAASRVASFAAYPILYMPLSFMIAGRLRERGVTQPSAVPRAAATAWLTYHLVKTMTHRQRPPSQQGTANDDRSYPSGHATAAAAIATSAAFLMLRNDPSRWPVIVPTAITVPLAIGSSRVTTGKHWPSDVLGGLATGAAVGALTTARRIQHATASDGDAH